MDRGRDTERDLRRAGRNWFDDDDKDDRYRRRGRRSGRRARDEDDLDGIRDALRELTQKVTELSRAQAATPTKN